MIYNFKWIKNKFTYHNMIIGYGVLPLPFQFLGWKYFGNYIVLQTYSNALHLLRS